VEYSVRGELREGGKGNSNLMDVDIYYVPMGQLIIIDISPETKNIKIKKVTNKK
jgi:hypothetical protein